VTVAGSSEDQVEFWTRLRSVTQARIGLGRAGHSLPTSAALNFRVAHAVARDAVHHALDVNALQSAVSERGLGTALVVPSRASSRGQYLSRPDLGREPATLAPLPRTESDLCFVLADGLSPGALAAHGAPILEAIIRQVAGEFTIAPVVIATQARVAIGDQIACALGAQTVIVLIGERPGLSVADSVGIYLTHSPSIGPPSPTTDADRNCVSNIHPPDGLGYEDAARITVGLLRSACALGRSGIDVKDRSNRATDAGSPISIASADPEKSVE
jgi:ethanolamine ammonia-lyase small subunit